MRASVEAAAADAQKILQAEAQGFRRKLMAERVVPTIVALRRRLDEICRQELESFLTEERGPFTREQNQALIIPCNTAQVIRKIASSLARELRGFPERGGTETDDGSRTSSVPPANARTGACRHQTLKGVANPMAKSEHRENWTGTQAYLLAVFCLVLGGQALGYLFRGSASPVAETAEASAPAGSSVAQSEPAQAQVNPEQQKAMLDQVVAPLLATLKANPDDFDTIVKVANLYYDGQQYPEAVKYYQLALKSQPTNADLLNRSWHIALVHGRRRRSHRRVSDGTEVPARSSGDAVQPGRSPVAR